MSKEENKLCQSQETVEVDGNTSWDKLDIRDRQELLEEVLHTLTEREKYLYGRVLTIIEAIVDEPRQKASKDIIRDAFGLYMDNPQTRKVRQLIRSYCKE